MMNALDSILSVLNTNLSTYDLRYCLVTATKLPMKIDDTPARPNHEEDFVALNDLLQCKTLESYAGIGISIQASKICAIDVDNCFSSAFDITSADERAKDVLLRFSKLCYCEFSFSGKGMRILFDHDVIVDYSDSYYIKNASKSIEFYQPTKSYRYVTITGKVIADNRRQVLPSYVLTEFLDDYMKKPERQLHSTMTTNNEDRSFDDLMKLVKRMYFKDIRFQDLWFHQAPGSGKNESELDYQLLATMYESVTQDKDLLRSIFEESPYFKSKDLKHVNKWNAQSRRYYDYIYSVIRRTHI